MLFFARKIFIIKISNIFLLLFLVKRIKLQMSIVTTKDSGSIEELKEVN